MPAPISFIRGGTGGHRPPLQSDSLHLDTFFRSLLEQILQRELQDSGIRSRPDLAELS